MRGPEGYIFGSADSFGKIASISVSSSFSRGLRWTEVAPSCFKKSSHTANASSFPMVFEPWSRNATRLTDCEEEGAGGEAVDGRVATTLRFPNCQVFWEFFV